MELLNILLLIGSCVAVTKASVCTTTLHGRCIGLSGGTCNSGYHLTFSYCGFLELCCYPTHYTSGSHTGSGSQTGSGSSATTHPPSQHISSGNCGVSTIDDHHRIVGGTLANNHEYPWQVSLMYRGHHMCGGTIINNQWIVTAAHCFEDTYHSQWTVGVGLHDRHHIYTNQVHRTANVIVHRSYNSKTNHNDIAMIKLDKPIDISGSTSRAACLPTSGESFDGLQCTVTGWGATHSGGSGQRYLHEVDVPIISNSLCGYYLSTTIYSSNICAGYTQGGRDACQGDSGGPLVCKRNGKWELAGIVSWGYGCGQRYAPGVYTRVSSFNSWINQQMAAHP